MGDSPAARSRSASATATAVLPIPVGPKRATTVRLLTGGPSFARPLRGRIRRRGCRTMSPASAGAAWLAAPLLPVATGAQRGRPPAAPLLPVATGAQRGRPGAAPLLPVATSAQRARPPPAPAHTSHARRRARGRRAAPRPAVPRRREDGTGSAPG